MTVLYAIIGCWLATLALFVALRVRATSSRTLELRRPMRAAQLRALKAHAGVRRMHVASALRVQPGTQRRSPSLAAIDQRR
jgi:hypothetical protein